MLFDVGYVQRNGYGESNRNVCVVLFAENEQDAIQKADYFFYNKSNIRNPESFEFHYVEEIPYDETTKIVYVSEY